MLKALLADRPRAPHHRGWPRAAVDAAIVHLGSERRIGPLAFVLYRHNIHMAHV